MHGGLFSNDGVTLADIRKLDRNQQPPDKGLFSLIVFSLFMGMQPPTNSMLVVASEIPLGHPFLFFPSFFFFYFFLPHKIEFGRNKSGVKESRILLSIFF